MTVRSKTLVITGVALLVLAAAVLGTALTLRMRDYVQFEEQDVAEDIQRVVRALDRECDNLDRSAADYAGWDDTYAFAADRNQAYLDDNFIDETLIKNDLSCVIIVDSAGEVLFSKALDLAEGKPKGLPDGLSEHLKPGGRLLANTDPETGAKGLLALSDSAWLVAARPILTSSYTGPSRGTVIFGREVDETFGAGIRELTGVEVCICGPGAEAEDAECASARAELAGTAGPFIRPVNEDVIRGFSTVKDLYGQPSLAIRIDTPRKFRSQFFAGLWLFSACTATALVVFGGMSVFIMDRHLLGRLGKLISFMRNVRADGNLAARLAIPGEDELTALADSTNDMLAALERGAAQRVRAEEALRASEAKYRELVQNANSIIMRWDVEGRITFFNEYAQRFFGYGEDEILGRNVIGTIVPETESTGRDLVSHIADVCKRTHFYRVNENENMTRDGSRVWISWTNKPIVDASGAVTGILSVGSDITDSRRAEQALRESERKYRRLVELAQEGVWQIDENALTTFVNPRMAEMLGHDVEEMEGTRLLDFVDDGTRATIENSLRTKGRLDRTEREVTLTRKDGSKMVTAVAAAPVVDGEGIFRGSVAVVSDVTEKRRAANELRDREARLESILRAAPSGIGVVVDRVFTEVNENFCRMLGYSRDELIGQSARMIYPTQEDFEYVGREKYRQINSAGVGTVETRFLCRDGRILDVLLSSSPIVAGDNHAGVTFAALDITDRKRMERALRDERQLFVAGPVVAFRWKNAEGWPLEFVSAHVAAQFGYQPADFIDGRIAYTGIIHADDLQRVLCEVESRTGSGANWYEQEYRIKRADGQYRWVHDFTVVVRDASGAATHCNGYVEDVTARKEAEEALNRERNLLRTLIDILPDCVYVMDRDGRKVMANPADLRSIGAKSMEDILGKTDVDLYPREIAEEFHANDQQVLTTGRPLLNKEEMMPAADGTTRTLLTTKVPLRDDQGRIVGLVGIGRDITGRKAALETIQRSERRYRELFESMTNAYALNELICDEAGVPVDYRLLDVNPAWERIIGVPREKVVGRTYRDLFGPVDAGWLEACARVVVTGESMTFERHSPAFGRWFDVFAYRIEGNRYATTFADVTERRKAEEEVRTLRGQIDFILGATKTGIDIVDSQFSVRFVDPEWAKLYGDYAGKKCYAYFMDRTEPCPGCGIKTALETKQVTVTEEVLVREGNRPIQVTTLPYQDSSGEWLVAEVNVDISDRKRLEAQLLQAHKLEAIGQLAGGIAHDFNNLLTGILGYAGILKTESSPGSQAFEAAATIEKAAERATELTKQLLGFARRGKYLKMPVDMHALIQEVIRLLSRTIEKSVAIVPRLSPHTPWVSSDPDQIEQMLLNLAVNARDAMPQGGELSIETEIVDVDDAYCRAVPDASPGRYVRLTVTDTGCGIPEAIRARIFEPFFTTKERGRGTGMGLAMVYGVTKNHGGFIRLDSKVGEGTRFDIYLPACEEVPPPPQPRRAPEKGSGRILFVDDEAVVRNVASDMLRSLGYEVTPAGSGDEAVDLLMREKGTFDLAIIDLVMPGLEARECFRKLRVICPSLKAILSSGFGLNGRAQETVDEGMVGFLQKPYTLTDLATAVGKALNHH